MNISHQKKYLYFVIPKCASKTLRRSIESYTDIGYPKTNYPQHMTLPEYLLGEYTDLFDSYFKFTFVRNPYDRLYSGFQQDLFASKNYRIWAQEKAPIFAEIGEDFNRYICEHVQASDIKTSWDWICFCPMTEFTHIDNEYRLDWFGRVESFDQDLAELASRLELKFSKVKNMNVNVEPSKGLKYLDKYNRETIDIINTIYRKDFEFFGYDMLDPRDFPVSRKETLI